MYTIRNYTVNSYSGRMTLKHNFEPIQAADLREVYTEARRKARFLSTLYEEVRMEIYHDNVLLQSESWWNHTCWTGETTRLHNVHTAPHRQHT